MRRYIIARIISAFFTWIVAMIVLFFLIRLSPITVEELLSSSYRLPEEAANIMRKKFGLDQPIEIQFLSYLRNVVFNFPPDFGFSYFYYPMKVWDIVIMYLGWTVFLLTLALILTFLIGLVVGVVMAWKRGTFIEKVLLAILTFSMSSPTFWLSYIFIILFSFTFHIFPPAGAFSPMLKPSFTLDFIINVMRHAALPLLTLVVTQFPTYAILLRDNMLYAFFEDYVTTAEAKGVKEITIVIKHVARSALLPVMTLFSMQIGLLLGGQIMIEIVFSYPGVGKLIFDAILSLDYPLVIGFFYLILTLGIIMNLIADIIYPFIDPRVRYE